jgi:hypothetical protein
MIQSTSACGRCKRSIGRFTCGIPPICTAVLALQEREEGL